MSDDPWLTEISPDDIKAAMQRKAAREALIVEQAAEITRLHAVSDEVRGYLSRLLQSLHPAIDLLPNVLGVCTQIDHVLGGQREEITRLHAALRWCIERDGDDLLICEGNHERHEGCTIQRWVKAENVATARRDAMEYAKTLVDLYAKGALKCKQCGDICHDYYPDNCTGRTQYRESEEYKRKLIYDGEYSAMRYFEKHLCRPEMMDAEDAFKALADAIRAAAGEGK